MNAAELQQIKKSWKNTMRKKQLGLVQKESAKNVGLGLADIISLQYALNVKKILRYKTDLLF